MYTGIVHSVWGFTHPGVNSNPRVKTQPLKFISNVYLYNKLLQHTMPFVIITNDAKKLHFYTLLSNYYPIMEQMLQSIEQTLTSEAFSYPINMTF